jgi:hypothetical protein
MKAALKGEVKVSLAPSEPIAESLKDFFGGKVRYLAGMMPSPHRQDGQDFLFVVVPYKLTEELNLEQSGPGVLCQTKAEADESLENLDKRTRKHLVSVQWPGAGQVGWVSNFRRYVTDILFFPKTVDDGKIIWVAIERETDQDTLEVKILRRKETDSEGEAKFWSNKWAEESNKKKADYFKSINKSVTPPPPARCTALTDTEIIDLGVAKMMALQKQWPHCFEIFEQQKSNPGIKITDQQMENAYLLDLVTNGGEKMLKSAKDGKVPAEIQFITSLTKAAQSYARRGKSKIVDAAISLIAFRWELGWCYLSDAQLAEELGKILDTKFAAEQVKKYRSRTLGLVAKHLPGPEPKVP